jgi:transcriptional regulator with XRE-family HTH domain
MGITRKERLKRHLEGPKPAWSTRERRESAINKSLCVRFDPDMGFRLSIVRRKLKYTQRELARMLGLSQQALCKIERGKTSLSNVVYLQLKSAIDRPGKNYMNFLFLGPPKAIWFEFIRLSSLKQMGNRDLPRTTELLSNYEMI